MRRWVNAAFATLLMTAAASAQDSGRPAFMSEAAWNQVKGLITPSAVQWHPYKGLAVKKDGSPYRILYLPVWMGDDYQVIALPVC